MGDEKSVQEAEEKPLPPMREVSSENLLQGSRELVITHGSETYRLRLTRNNKLILTK